MTETEQQRPLSYVYVRINKKTVALFFIAEKLNISKYQLFLLYETFGDDCFLFFQMFSRAGLLPALTNFRLRRCFLYADRITPALLGKDDIAFSSLDLSAYKRILPYCYEDRLKIQEDLRALD